MPQHSDSQPFGPRDASLVLLAAVLLRNIRWLLGIPASAIALLVAIHFLRPQQWIAQSRLMPESANRESAGLVGLADQLALSIGTGRETESLDFYIDLVASSSFLDSLALTRFPTPDGTISGGEATLLDIMDIRGATQTERLQRGRSRLRRDVTLQPLRRSGLLVATTRALSPALAEAMNHRVLDLVDAFNQTRRQSRASAEGRFIEERLRVVRDSLASAQAELIEFARRNRQPSSTSPELFVERSRLERNVDLLATLHSQLAQSYERARLDEVRNTPVVTIVDPPDGTAQQGATLGREIVIAVVVGGLFALGLVFLLEHVRQRMKTPEERDALLGAWHSARVWSHRKTPHP